MVAQLQLSIVEQTIEETIGLLGEPLDWVAKNINSKNRPPTNERFNIVTQQCKVVLRLEWVMAWLMFRKAVATGEIDQSHSLRELLRLDA
jgi:hypothetical protein